MRRALLALALAAAIVLGALAAAVAQGEVRIYVLRSAGPGPIRVEAWRDPSWFSPRWGIDIEAAAPAWIVGGRVYSTRDLMGRAL